MSTPTTLTIDGVEYIRKSDAPAGKPTAMQIVIADRGWVFVGRTFEMEDKSLVINDAKCIRYWGTDEKRPGLGYLALHGPTEKTKLDPCGTLRISLHAVIATLDAVESKWV